MEHFSAGIAFNISTMCFLFACMCDWYNIIPMSTLHGANTTGDKLKISAIYLGLEILCFLMSLLIVWWKKLDLKKAGKAVWMILRTYIFYIFIITFAYVTHVLRLWL